MRNHRPNEALSRSARQRQHLVRYLGAGQSRFGQQKRHLTASCRRWRVYVWLVFLALLAVGLAGVWRELN